MDPNISEKTDSGTKPARWLTSNARLVLFLFVLFTALLIPAALFTSDRGEASAEPGGEAFDLRDELEFWLISPVFPTAYIVEARNGDVLTKKTISSLASVVPWFYDFCVLFSADI